MARSSLRRIGFLGVLLLGVGVGLAIWRGGGRTSGSVEPRASAAPVLEQTPPAQLVEVGGVLGDPAPAISQVDEVVERQGVEALPPRRDPQLAELNGRLVFEGGSPAAGVTLRLRGAPGNQDRIRQHGPPKGWEDLETASAPDGSFSLVFDPPRAFQFFMDAKVPGYAEASWRWYEIRPGETQDLGDVVLQRGGNVAVRVEDATGDPIEEPRRIYGDSLVEWDPSTGRDNSRIYTRDRREDGSYLLVDLPAGPAEISADGDDLADTRIEVLAGETVEVHLVRRGPDPATQIRFAAWTRPFYAFDPRRESIRLVGPEGERAPVHARNSATWIFDGLQDGSYRIEVDDPQFQPWSKDGVRPGDKVEAKLVGSAALDLRIVDGRSRERVSPEEIRVRYRGVDFIPAEFSVLEPGDSPPPDGIYSGVVPGDITVAVVAGGFATVEIDVDGLKPGQTRLVPVELTVPGSISGVVRYGDGDAATFVDVRLLPADLVPVLPTEREGVKAWTLMNLASAPHALRERARIATTGVAGRFSFGALNAGRYDLWTTTPEGLRASLHGVDVRAGESTQVELDLPPLAVAFGRAVAPPGTAFQELAIELEAGDQVERDFDELSGGPGREAPVRAALSTDGSFRFDPLPAGLYRPSVILASKTRNSWTSTLETPREGEDGWIRLHPGDNDLGVFDVGSHVPGYIDVLVTLEGMPVAGATIEAYSVRFFGPRTARTDGEGRGRVGPLQPETYVLLASDRDAIAVPPEPVRIQPGGRASLSLDLRTDPGSLRIRDAETGEVLANQRVVLYPVFPGLEELCKAANDAGVGVHFPSPTARIASRTDEEGIVQLELVEGTYDVVRGRMWAPSLVISSLGAPLPRIRWSPMGPVPAEISVPSGRRQRRGR